MSTWSMSCRADTHSIELWWSGPNSWSVNQSSTSNTKFVFRICFTQSFESTIRLTLKVTKSSITTSSFLYNIWNVLLTAQPLTIHWGKTIFVWLLQLSFDPLSTDEEPVDKQVFKGCDDWVFLSEILTSILCVCLQFNSFNETRIW